MVGNIRYLIGASSFLLVLHVAEILGHGMLIDPIHRGSVWRLGYSSPINYNDNENFCGGYSQQWNENGGKCGVCGDDYALAQPRPNENTGTYGTGISVATYEAGSWVNLTVWITANHKGYFRFNICPLASGPNEIETEDCFDEYSLVLDDGSYKYTLPSTETGLYHVTVKLPELFTCERCVIRWDWTTGNNWGLCSDEDEEQKTWAVGCGPQETFRTCSDITIV